MKTVTDLLVSSQNLSIMLDRTGLNRLTDSPILAFSLFTDFLTGVQTFLSNLKELARFYCEIHKIEGGVNKKVNSILFI